MERLIIVGSPRTSGRSTHLAEALFDACIEECPDDGISMLSMATATIAPCIGCDACATALNGDLSLDSNLASSSENAENDNGADASFHRCIYDDDMTEARTLLDSCDELIMITPVYFSGVPAQMKAFLDRFQPYYWSTARALPKRPLILHVVGEGGDPHGFSALISEVKSACAVAGFQLEAVHNWVGCLSSDGELIGEPTEVSLEDVCPKRGSQSSQSQESRSSSRQLSPQPQPQPQPRSSQLRSSLRQPSKQRREQHQATRHKGGKAKKNRSRE